MSGNYECGSFKQEITAILFSFYAVKLMKREAHSDKNWQVHQL